MENGRLIWRPQMNEQIWISLSRQKCFLVACELLYLLINTFFTAWNAQTENHKERAFLSPDIFAKDTIAIQVIQDAVFLKWKTLRG